MRKGFPTVTAYAVPFKMADPVNKNIKTIKSRIKIFPLSNIITPSNDFDLMFDRNLLFCIFTSSSPQKHKTPFSSEKQDFNNLFKASPLQKGFRLVVNLLTMPYLNRPLFVLPIL